MKEWKNKVFELADDFINTELDGNADPDTINKNNAFLIYFISRHIKRYIDKDNIECLIDVFNDYVYLCLKYNILPSLKMYCILCDIDINMFYEWVNNENVSYKYKELANKIHNTCKTMVENRLTNSERVNVNLMFISKAVYGYTETAPIQKIEKIDIKVNDLQSISNRYNSIKGIDCNVSDE